MTADYAALLISAVFVTYHPVILANMFGKERLNTAYGIALVADGIPCLVGPPVAGT